MQKLSFAVAGTLAIVASCPVPVVAAEPMGPSWYAGVFGGGLSYDGEVWLDDWLASETNGTLGTAGLLAGIRMQQGDWFFGGEVDAALSFGQEIDADGVGCSDSTILLEWCDQSGTLHARGIIGYSIDGLDIFASAGLAAASMKYDGLEGTESHTLTGYSIGAGAEYHVNETLSLRLEALHDCFSDQEFSDGYTGKWSQNTVRGAAIFHFD